MRCGVDMTTNRSPVERDIQPAKSKASSIRPGIPSPPLGACGPRTRPGALLTATTLARRAPASEIINLYQSALALIGMHAGLAGGRVRN